MASGSSPPPPRTPTNPLKRENSDPDITPLFGKRRSITEPSGVSDPLNIAVYLLRKEHDMEWHEIAADVNVRYGLTVANGKKPLSGRACYMRFYKYSEAIARSRGEPYQRDWYIADAHNRASQAIDNQSLNETIYLLRRNEGLSWAEMAKAINEKYELQEGVRGREPVNEEKCWNRFNGNAASIARSRGEEYQKERYTRRDRQRMRSSGSTSSPLRSERPARRHENVRSRAQRESSVVETSGVYGRRRVSVPSGPRSVLIEDETENDDDGDDITVSPRRSTNVRSQRPSTQPPEKQDSSGRTASNASRPAILPLRNFSINRGRTASNASRPTILPLRNLSTNRDRLASNASRPGTSLLRSPSINRGRLVNNTSSPATIPSRNPSISRNHTTNNTSSPATIPSRNPSTSRGPLPPSRRDTPIPDEFQTTPNTQHDNAPPFPHGPNPPPQHSQPPEPTSRPNNDTVPIRPLPSQPPTSTTIIPSSSPPRRISLPSDSRDCTTTTTTISEAIKSPVDMDRRALEAFKTVKAKFWSDVTALTNLGVDEGERWSQDVVERAVKRGKEKEKVGGEG